jgi:hypothetical protein
VAPVALVRGENVFADGWPIQEGNGFRIGLFTQFGEAWVPAVRRTPRTGFYEHLRVRQNSLEERHIHPQSFARRFGESIPIRLAMEPVYRGAKSHKGFQ